MFKSHLRIFTYKLFLRYFFQASRYSKMEKADVLEMTVHYLRELKRREQKQQGTDIFMFLFHFFDRVVLSFINPRCPRYHMMLPELLSNIRFLSIVRQIAGESCFKIQLKQDK